MYKRQAWDFYSLLFLVCFPHPLKIIFLYCRHLIFTFCSLNIPISNETFLNFTQLSLLSTCCGFSAILLPFLFLYLFDFTSKLIVYPSHSLSLCSHCPFVFYLCCKFCSLLFFASLLINSHQFSYKLYPLLPHNNISPSFSDLIFPLSYLIISTILLHLY